jgi:hypothetical protein
MLPATNMANHAVLERGLQTELPVIWAMPRAIPKIDYFLTPATVLARNNGLQRDRRRDLGDPAPPLAFRSVTAVQVSVGLGRIQREGIHLGNQGPLVLSTWLVLRGAAARSIDAAAVTVRSSWPRPRGDWQSVDNWSLNGARSL